MRLVLTHPNKRFSIHEAARASKLSVNACKYSLDYMFQNGMVTQEEIGRTYQYRVNLQSPLAKQWKILFSVEELEARGIIKKILEAKKDVLTILLYGSVAVGRDDELSDIDLLVIADTDREGKKTIASNAHGTAKELNISVYTPLEWKTKARNDKIFYEHVIIDSIVLYGDKPVVL